ncbi:HofO family protein [Atlantibacter hermannii]|uniref:HofO family protein n=2 Tax=Atlantibacter hermannii TaxID=565 RepID=UPI0028AF572B|nr:hypothetical protein [Atlantibacter hermannii]MDU1950089.1 hypothetical protein [Atlantibacter hermannii]
MTMRRPVEQWLTAGAWHRIVTWIVVMLLLTTLCWALMIRPAHRTLEQWRTERAATLHALEQEQHKARELEIQIAAAQRNLPALEVHTLSAASVSALPGVTLMTWQPKGKRASLAVRGQWQPLLKLFTALADTDARLTGFSFSPGEDALMLTLQLEIDHES